MRRQTLIGLGVGLVLSVVCGCSGDDAPGSSVAQTKGGSGGTGGEAGTLNLGLGGGGAGAGGGGAGGAAGSAGAGVAGATGGVSQGGSAVAGSNSSGGSGGSGGSKPAGMCKRATGNDADCADFDPTTPQAYACDDPSAYLTLNNARGGKCYSGNFVPGSKYSACCPP